jgi:hypothetical protein
MMSRHRFAWIAAAVLAGTLFSAGSASAATPWTVSHSANVRGFADWLTNVSASSPSDAWAIGAIGEPNSDGAMVEHWNGTRWRIATTSAAGGDSLTGIYDASASDVWIGGYGDIDPILLHYNGTSWTRTTLPLPAGQAELIGPIKPRSGIDLWTAGAHFSPTSGAERVYLDHWNGSRWRPIFVSSNRRSCTTGVTGMHEISKRDVWFETATFCGAMSTESLHQWNGTSVVLQAPPTGAPGSSYSLAGVGAASPTSPVFLVGSWTGGSGVQNSLADIYDGGTWTEHDPPAFSVNHWLNAVASTSASSAWAVGNRSAGADTDNLLDFWNGSTWTEYGGPNPKTTNTLSDVTAVPGSDQWWAVGSTGRKTLILHCCT